MAIDRREWFRELEPPPGGAERLRRRLEQSARPTIGLVPRMALAAAAAVIAAIVLFVVTGRDDVADREAVADVYQAAQFDRLLGRPIERTELSVSVDQLAVPVSRLNGANPKIRIYQVD